MLFFFFVYYIIKKITFSYVSFFFFFIHVTFTTDDSEEREQKGKRGIERVCRAKGKVSSGTPSLVRQAALIHVHRVRFSRWLPRMAESIPETF